MATQATRFEQRIESASWSLVEQAKLLRDQQMDPGVTIIDIKLESGKAATLLELCKQVEDVKKRMQFEFIILKAQKKLVQAELINQFLQKGDADAVHPRVEQLIARLTRMKQLPEGPVNVAKFIQKFYKTRTQFDLLASSNCYHNLSRETYWNARSSFHAYSEARLMLQTLEMQLLEKSHQIVYFSETYSALHENYSPFYAKFEVPKDAQKLSSALYAIHYLGYVTKFSDLRVKRFTPEGPINQLHESMAQYITEHVSTNRPLPIGHLIGTLYKDKLVPIPYTPAMLDKHEELKQGPLSYAIDANVEEIQKKLETLIELKYANLRLSSIGAFVAIGTQAVAIVFHSTGRISLYNPCAEAHWEAGRFTSYVADFANAEQAAAFLKELTVKIGPNLPITLKPYVADMSQKYNHALTSLQTSWNSSSATPMMPSEEELESSPTEVAPTEDGYKTQDDDESDEDEPVSAQTVLEMQRIIHLLTPKSHDAYCQSLPYIHSLDCVQWQADGTALDRVYFHLSKIQEKETPDKVDRTDANWGKTAFETEALSTPDQKLRAVQRTQVELILDLIRSETQDMRDRDMLALLNALEGLQLQASDLPKGQNNAAIALFDKGLKMLNESRRKISVGNFPGDEQSLAVFKRQYFLMKDLTCDECHPKIQALAELANDFKTAWGI